LPIEEANIIMRSKQEVKHLSSGVLPPVFGFGGRKAFVCSPWQLRFLASIDLIDKTCISQPFDGKLKVLCTSTFFHVSIDEFRLFRNLA